MTLYRAEERADTVGDIVEQLSGYSIANKDDILEAKPLFLHMTTHNAADGTSVTSLPDFGFNDTPDDTRLFFGAFIHDTIEVGDCSINVYLWTKGQFGESIKRLWMSRCTGAAYDM